MKKKLLPITTFARIDIKRLFRDKVAIFFVFVFPLIFLMIFGSIFNSDNNVSFRVGLLNNSQTEFAKQFEQQLRNTDVLKIDAEITNLDLANEKMNRGQLDATIELPPDFGEVKEGADYPTGQAKVIYSQSNATAGTTLGAVLNDVFKDINQKLVPTTAPFTVVTESTAKAGLRQFDYTFAGILGFTLLSLGIFGPTTVFPRLKQRGVLRRYRMTTIKVWQYFTANVLSTGFIGLLAVALMFTAALTIFDLNMRGSYFNLVVVVILGTVMLFGIGLSLGGWAKNENQAAPLAQLITLPMMFLSGVFFPTFLMPEVLQKITQFIPLTPVIDSTRLIITENASLVDLGPQLAVICGWLVVVYIIAFKVFRWE